MYDEEDDDEPRAFEDDDAIEDDVEMIEDDSNEISAELWQVNIFL